MASNVRCFRDLLVWQKANELFLNVAMHIERFPNTSAAEVISRQLLRSTSSIGANIAEGFGRQKGREFQRFLTIARGSTTESQDWLLKCDALNLLDGPSFVDYFRSCEEIKLMLNAMLKTLRNKQSN